MTSNRFNTILFYLALGAFVADIFAAYVYAGFGDKYHAGTSLCWAMLMGVCMFLYRKAA